MSLPGTKYAIVSGPAKDALAAALVNSSNAKPVTVAFGLVHDPKTAPTTVNVRILSVQAEDGSGESWNIEGYLVAAVHRTFKCYYSTHPKRDPNNMGVLTLQ